MRPLSEATAKISGKSFERKYIALGRIVNNWTEIIGQSLADKAQPVKIFYRKSKDKNKQHAVLQIATSSAQAQRLHYQKGLMLERMNQIFGEEWITDIKFVPSVSNQTAKNIKTKKRPSPLTSAQKNSLSQMVFEIEDEDIKARLLALGTGIYQKEHS